MRRVLALAALLVMLAGCAAGTGGSDALADPTALDLPPRPREVQIDGVDPCSLLTEEQRLGAGLDGEPTSDSSFSVFAQGEVIACSIRGFSPDAVRLGIGMVTTMGIEPFVRGDVEAEVRPLDIRGFPAVLAIPHQFSTFCSVEIDVADGQTLDVQLSDGGRTPPVLQDQLCHDVQRIASTVMDSLLVIR